MMDVPTKRILLLLWVLFVLLRQNNGREKLHQTLDELDKYLLSRNTTFTSITCQWQFQLLIMCIFQFSAVCINQVGSNSFDVNILNKLNESVCVTLEGKFSKKDVGITKLKVGGTCVTGSEVI